MAERFLTLYEAANRLDVSNQVIREWLRNGRLKGVKAGRLWIVLAGAYKAQADVLVSLDKRHILTEKVRKSFPIPVKDTKRFLKDLADVISIQTKLI